MKRLLILLLLPLGAHASWQGQFIGQHVYTDKDTSETLCAQIRFLPVTVDNLIGWTAPDRNWTKGCADYLATLRSITSEYVSRHNPESGDQEAVQFVYNRFLRTLSREDARNLHAHLVFDYGRGQQ